MRRSVVSLVPWLWDRAPLITHAQSRASSASGETVHGPSAGTVRDGGRWSTWRGLRTSPMRRSARSTFNGGFSHKDYIVETMAAGAPCSISDMNGWLDIFVLCGTRFGPAVEGATNRRIRTPELHFNECHRQSRVAPDRLGIPGLRGGLRLTTDS